MAEPNLGERELGSTVEGVSNAEDFPTGMKVLVVDDDPVCLAILCQRLKEFRYHVTRCGEGKRALEILREKKGDFHLVLTDVRMPDMDGFKLLEHVSFEMDLPVVMMSDDSSTETVTKAINHGACYFIPKPITNEMLKCIHQNVLIKNMNNKGNDDDEKKTDDAKASASRSTKKRKEVIEGGEDREETRANGPKKNLKKAKRFQWAETLHAQFLDAINKLGGINGAVPRKILGIMDVPGLRREHVASHLQKYRDFIKNNEEKQRKQQEQLLNNQMLANQTMTSQYFTSQPIGTGHRKPLAYGTYSNPLSHQLSNRSYVQNSTNAHVLLANSTNMPLETYMQHQQQQQQQQLVLLQQQQQQQNLMTNTYQNNLQFGNNIISNPFCTSTSSVFIPNNDGNVGNNNGNGLMGMIKAGSTPTRYGMDGLESPTSNLTAYSNTCSETVNNQFGWNNGHI